ncbi:MAG: SAM-dependent methyltransferase, partial [Limnohabitans sp.]
MHPKALLDSCAELLKLCLTFEHPADAVGARDLRAPPTLGPRARGTQAEKAVGVVRQKIMLEQQ